MTRKGTILGALCALVLGGACSFTSTPSPQPDPSPSEPDISVVNCADSGVEPPELEPGADPYATKPAMVPEGWRWARIEMRVEMTDPQTRWKQYCRPIAVHVYGTYAGGTALAIVVAGVTHALPYDVVTTSPWTAGLVVAYNPQSERFKMTPPSYQLDLQATYLNERDMDQPAPPMTIACSIGVRGAPFSTAFATIGNRGFVSCPFNGAFYQG